MVKKKILVIVIPSLVTLLAVGIWLFFFRFKSQSSLVSPLSPAEEEEVEWLVWEDPAGFSFSYPKNIQINSHEEDKENYAHLEMTASEHPGNVIIWLKDTQYTKLEDWVKAEATQGGQVFDTELGGEPAKKVVSTQPNKLVVAAIDVDALLLIEMTPDEEDYWQETFNKVLSSFTYLPLEGEEAVAPAAGGGGRGIIEEAEEVIE